EELSQLQNLQDDAKAAAALEILQEWIKGGYHPVVFCRFIATANYLGTLLKPALPQVDVQVVTSEDPDELRKARIDEMDKPGRRLLIATDCLSEGINLQKLFTAVLHYDLPWNPNRLEQREGRIDRYGQQAPTVKAFLLYGSDNPIDGVVLKVLLRKVREIRQSIGISLPFPEDSQSLMDAVLQSVLLTSRRHPDRAQLALDFGESEETRQKELVA
ncbi:MAG: SWF/SNF helicase family protein, partial [Thermomicrobiales bacterium]|nr:SWF/SNF helicase family protein [Thermomicrobiales bacterium]